MKTKITTVICDCCGRKEETADGVSSLFGSLFGSLQVAVGGEAREHFDLCVTCRRAVISFLAERGLRYRSGVPVEAQVRS